MDETNPTATLALVTGASRGIGFEVVRQLALAGMTVILTARDESKAQAAAQVLSEEDLNVRAETVDVTDSGSIARLATRVETDYRRLDVLVNNAAAYVDWTETASNADLNAVQAVLDTNLLGSWRMVQAFLPLIRQSPHGRIVNVSSGAGSHGDHSLASRQDAVRSPATESPKPR